MPEKKLHKNISWYQFIISTILTITVGILAYLNDTRNIKLTEIAQRPWLAVEPIKFESDNTYILAYENEKGYFIKVQFKITNNGQSIANNIKTSDIFMRTEEIFADCEPKITFRNTSKAIISPSGPVSLAPNESVFVTIESEYALVDVRAFQDLKERIKNNSHKIPFNIEIYYSGGKDSKINGKVGISSTFTSQEVNYNYKINE